MHSGDTAEPVRRTTVNFQRHDDVVVVEIANPPVNALSRGVMTDLCAALDGIARDSSLKAVVLAGTGRTFTAGADIRELQAAAIGGGAPPDLHPLMTAVESCGVPVVMALHGSVLGGGLELAMAGHFRVAAQDARLGLPEIHLGLMPGGEGTQRLPRLVGLAAAIDMCVSGATISAWDALAVGLVDQVVDDDLRDAALAAARTLASSRESWRKTSDRPVEPRDLERALTLLAAGRENASGRWPGLLAAESLIDALSGALDAPFEEGCRHERRLFERTVASTAARERIARFFADRQAAKTTRPVP